MPAFAFNSQGIDATYGGGGSQLPVGKHPVVISASALKPTQDNTGGYIEFTLTAIDGPAKGQSQTDRLNMHNKNPQTVEIANKQLAAYCAVTNTPSFQATEELHNKPFVVDIGPQKANAQYHEVKALFDMNGNEPGKAGSGPQSAGGAPNNGFGGQPQGQGGFGAQGGGSIPPAGQGGFGQGGQGAGNGFGGGDPNAGQGQGGAPAGGNAWGQAGGAGGAPAGQGGGQAGGGWQQGGGAPAGGGQPGWGQR